MAAGSSAPELATTLVGVLIARVSSIKLFYLIYLFCVSWILNDSMFVPHPCSHLSWLIPITLN